MFGSSTLDVAIGLAFLYLLLSLLCTAANEFWEVIRQKRGKFLEMGIKELLGGKDVGNWLQKFYTHPLIFSLFSGEYKPGSRSLPSYVPSRQFALALLDLVLPANKPGANNAPGTNLSGAANTTAPQPAKPVPVAVFVEQTPPAPTAPAVPAQITELRKAIADSEFPEKVRKALLALLDSAGNDFNQILTNIEQWYDGTMDRVAGWYRRRVQWISAIFGFVMAAALNADTFAIADSLARDQVLRSTVATAAENYAKNHPQPPATPVPAPAPDPKGKTQTPEDENAKKEREKKEKDEKDLEEVKAALGRVSASVNDVRGFGWPLGWDFNDSRTIPASPFEKWGNPKHEGERALGAWMLKVLGWLLTAAAISLGAPFWFDTLNRLIVVRSTVKPTEKSPEEPSADRK